MELQKAIYNILHDCRITNALLPTVFRQNIQNVPSLKKKKKNHVFTLLKPIKG